MKIVIIRHGEAHSSAQTDVQRELTDKGREQIQLAAKCLLEQGMSFDQIWTSPYKRTKQTANEIITHFPNIEIVSKDILVPESDPAVVIEAIESSELNSLLIVSHQPLVSALVGMMVETQARFGPPMSPASMAHLNADVVLPGCCTLNWMRHAPNFEISQ